MPGTVTASTPVYANATPSGKVTRKAFQAVSGEILAAIDAESPFDAMLLSLHGSMVVEHADDGGGLTSRDYRSLPYKRARRPIHPLDLD